MFKSGGWSLKDCSVLKFAFPFLEMACFPLRSKAKGMQEGGLNGWRVHELPWLGKINLQPFACLKRCQRKTKGQQLKGKPRLGTFSHFLALFRTFSHFFRAFQKLSSRIFLRNKEFYYC